MASAIFQHTLMAGQAHATNAATPLDATTSGTSAASGTDDSTTSGDSATISANDFLTLLVTEMQNQDPTADTDPNEYINQLVQVNSLEQLIDINQTLSGDASGSSDSSASSSSATSPNSAASDSDVNPSGGNQSAILSPPAWSKTSQIMKAMNIGGTPSLGSLGSAGHASIASAESTSTQVQARTHTSPIAGNLGIEKTNPAATRVGHALAGRTHAATATPASN